MIQRYFSEPYRFIAPYRSTLWCRLARPFFGTYLRRVLRIYQWRVEGIESLRSSLDQQAGILLAANHCRRSDPASVALLAVRAKQFFYFMGAYHQFKQNRAMGWLLNRVGGYSVWREGTDRECLRVSADVLARAERPIVVFPEGTWLRQNDRLGPIQEGFALIARQAARQAARPIVVHPVAIKYWLLEDPRPVLESRLEALERALSWSPQCHLDLVVRIEKLSSALLTIKELEHYGCAQPGLLDSRVQQLADSLVARLEKTILSRVYDDWVLKRIRRLRQVLVRRLLEPGDADEVSAVRRDLDILVFCENLCANSHTYLLERASLERLTEAVQRIEETVRDEAESPVAAVGVTVAVGPAIAVTNALAVPYRQADPLVARVAVGIQDLLSDMLARGAPSDWDCPTPFETPDARLPSRNRERAKDRQDTVASITVP